MTNTEPAVLMEKKEGIARITINRPERRNALSKEVLDGLAAAMEDARKDASIKVVTTTGAGDIAYSAGMDVKELLHRHDNPGSSEAPGVSLIIREFPKVTIAIVNGYALGAGLSLMNAHDLAIASEENSKFGLPEIIRSFVPHGAIVPLCRNTHLKWALEMLLTGKNWDAQRAYQSGLINRVVPHAQLQAEGLALAQEIAQWDPMTLKYCKKAAYSSLEGGTYRQALELVALWQGEEARLNPRTSEGLRHFVSGKGIKANK